MNKTQTKVWNYLLSGEGHESSRKGALKVLVEQDFFDPGKSDDQSVRSIKEFIDARAARGDYCSSGVERFRNAILPVEEKVDQVTITMVVDLKRVHPGLRKYEATSECKVLSNFAASTGMLLDGLGVKQPSIGTTFATYEVGGLGQEGLRGGNDRRVVGSTISVEVTKTAGNS